VLVIVHCLRLYTTFRKWAYCRLQVIRCRYTDGAIPVEKLTQGLLFSYCSQIKYSLIMTMSFKREHKGETAVVHHVQDRVGARTPSSPVGGGTYLLTELSPS
jgi:hypothetical protein